MHTYEVNYTLKKEKKKKKKERIECFVLLGILKVRNLNKAIMEMKPKQRGSYSGLSCNGLLEH